MNCEENNIGPEICSEVLLRARKAIERRIDLWRHYKLKIKNLHTPEYARNVMAAYEQLYADDAYAYRFFKELSDIPYLYIDYAALTLAEGEADDKYIYYAPVYRPGTNYRVYRAVSVHSSLANSVSELARDNGVVRPYSLMKYSEEDKMAKEYVEWLDHLNQPMPSKPEWFEE